MPSINSWPLFNLLPNSGAKGLFTYSGSIFFFNIYSTFENTKCGHWNESNEQLFTFSIVCYLRNGSDCSHWNGIRLQQSVLSSVARTNATLGSCYFCVCGWKLILWPFKWKLLSGRCILCCRERLKLCLDQSSWKNRVSAKCMRRFKWTESFKQSSSVPLTGFQRNG